MHLQEAITTNVNVNACAIIREKNRRVTQSRMLNYRIIRYYRVNFRRSRLSRGLPSREFARAFVRHVRDDAVSRRRKLLNRVPSSGNKRHELHDAGLENFRADTSLLADLDRADRKRKREKESESVPKAGRMRYVVGGKKQSALLEDHRGIECYLSSPPHRASPRAHLERAGRGRRNGQIDTVFCFK